MDMQLLCRLKAKNSYAKVNVGNINHSWKFASELRPAFAEAVESRVKDYIQRPLEATLNLPPVGIVSEKITTKRRTGQMFAGVLFTPAMDNLLTPVSLGIESVTKRDGDSIAQDIHELCKIHNIQGDGPQISGFGFDGQYFHLSVPTKLKQKMKLSDPVNFFWDPAHKLQLADGDMRKQIDWVDNICKDIATVLRKFRFGKMFEAAIHQANALQIDSKSPLWFSETRFAAYAHTVIKNFVENYCIWECLYSYRQTRSRRPTADSDGEDPETVDSVADIMINSVTDKGKALFAAMNTSMKTRFPEEYLDEMEEKSHPAKLYPILTSAKVAENEEDCMASEEVKLLISKHHDDREQIRNLCFNIYRNATMLGDCASDIDIYCTVAFF
ncbi:hypothetical protein BSL78_09840 [Apostichopus japonicus]|uniref:Uncharacterized protein n=1 Tax=Stichopus japonicus TaxID=307972 RepID=A0A2G8KZ24_STIJA|nr:hypothetical protein BSL78_09840 [Apostichopus japonicus]